MKKKNIIFISIGLNLLLITGLICLSYNLNRQYEINNELLKNNEKIEIKAINDSDNVSAEFLSLNNKISDLEREKEELNKIKEVYNKLKHEPNFWEWKFLNKQKNPFNSDKSIYIYGDSNSKGGSIKDIQNCGWRNHDSRCNYFFGSDVSQEFLFSSVYTRNFFFLDENNIEFFGVENNSVHRYYINLDSGDSFFKSWDMSMEERDGIRNGEYILADIVREKMKTNNESSKINFNLYKCETRGANGIEFCIE